MLRTKSWKRESEHWGVESGIHFEIGQQSGALLKGLFEGIDRLWTLPQADVDLRYRELGDIPSEP